MTPPATADGWITVGAANRVEWLRLVEALGAPELAADPRLATNADCIRHPGELQAARVPAGPILDVKGDARGSAGAGSRDGDARTPPHGMLGEVGTMVRR